MGLEPAGVLLHKSMPMFKLVPGTEPTGLPGTEFGKLVVTPLFCALAPVIKSQSHQSKQNSGNGWAFQKPNLQQASGQSFLSWIQRSPRKCLTTHASIKNASVLCAEECINIAILNI